MQPLVERFIKYVQIDTQSSLEIKQNPSTEKQFKLAQLLVENLKSIGASNVQLSDYCYVTAEIPGNVPKAPTIGLIAHMDTATEMSGNNVKPHIIQGYDGHDILLNDELDIWMKTEDFPDLLNYVGQDLIVTDGTTLLGADNKAGVAEIVSAAEYIIQNPQIQHGTIKIAFTPDEEVGMGTLNFDLDGFNADFAYTVDGGPLGELEYETFNATMAKIHIQGRNVHPGTAKNKMISAQRIGFELDAMLPENEKPEFTTGDEGFFHLVNCNGDVESFNMLYIIRDHDINKFRHKKDLLNQCINYLTLKYPHAKIINDMQDQYYNMSEKIKPVFHIVETAKKVMEALDIEPIIKPIRGGTDGAALSLKGLPTPNLFTGGHHFHGKFEYIPIQSMEKSVQVIVGIITAYGQTEM